jgi:protein TonB
VSRAAEERAAIVALRERWHARDRQRAKRGAGGPRVSRSTVGAFLAVIALIMTAGFGLAVFQSPGLPALVERLDRLRVVAVERFSQTLLDLQQSKISIEPLGPAGAGPTGAPSDAGSAGAHLRARKVVDEGASGIRKAGTDGERLAANADGVGFAGGVREPEGVVEQNESPVAAPDLPFGAPIAPVPVMPVSPVAPDATTGTGDRGGQSLAAIRARPRFVFVDTPPSLRARLRPQYPEALAGRAIGGTVTLWVLVSETGKVEGVRVLRSSGQPELDEAAADAVWLASYTPAQRGGAPVPTWTQQAVTFRLD